ncbi:MAG: class I tRNA ligase family protein, partial [Patescibacteria group bacterium]
DSNLYQTTEDPKKKKTFVLDMFPYPSGEGLHVGHPKGYIASDVYSRHMRMRGNDVLHPMGWDAFGLPAENFALKNKIHPRIAVEKNIKRFKEQLSILGFDYDWKREINTTDPKYYKWTQWIFLQLFKKGLAYQSDEPINWCPSCMTGLANEDLEGNSCERCGTLVEKKKLPQWVLRITDYADRLIEDLKTLNWAEHIKELQRNWIGRSEGHSLQLALKVPGQGEKHKVEIFTTRLDTLAGATFVVVSPELADRWINIGWKASEEVKKYVVAALKQRDKEHVRTTALSASVAPAPLEKEKTGVKTDITAKNPLTGEDIPVFVSDYVLGNVGTGAIMAVPAHDDRDFEFAKKYKLPIKYVVAPYFIDETENSKSRPGVEIKHRTIGVGIVKHWAEDKYLMLDWKNGWTGFITGGVDKGEDLADSIRREIKEETGYTNVRLLEHLGGPNISDFYAPHKKLNQRVLGYGMYLELIDATRVGVPKEELEKHSMLWVDKDRVLAFLKKGSPMGDSRYSEMYWERLTTENYIYSGDGLLINSGEFNGLSSSEGQEAIAKKVKAKKATNYKLRDWVFSRQRYWGEPIPIIHCVKCGAVPVPEKDLPVLLPEVESYEPSGTGESPLVKITDWVNVKCPECGGSGKRETNTMPQWAGSSWYYLRYMDPGCETSPVSKKKEKYWSPVDVYVGGIDHATRHLIYARFWHKFLYDIGTVSTVEPFARLNTVGFILAEDGRKMSKRVGNVINPDDMVEEYGSDAFRIYEMFMGPFENTIAWNTKGVVGARRFIERICKFSDKIVPETIPSLEPALHQTIKKVGEDIQAFKFNTAISQLMICLNEMETIGSVGKEQWKNYLALLAPFAPHVSEELWGGAGGNSSIHTSEWPSYEESKFEKETYVIAVQVNGKSRGTITLIKGASEVEAKDLAEADPAIAKWLVKGVKKVVYIPGKVLNFVIQS